MMIRCQCQKRLHSAQGSYLLDINFNLLKSEILVLTGSSGSGKTTLLRLLAGLEKPDQGRIVSDHRIWVDTAKGINLSPQKRAVGMVFQDYALFPNMSVRKNLAYALPPKASSSIVDDMLFVLDLVALADKKPHQLSGGQQQRVALGRAIIPKPTVLLLDEPLSALDQHFREQMQRYLLHLHQEYAFSMIIVSHDQQEIYTLAHRIATLEQGEMTISANKPIQPWQDIQQEGTTLEGNLIEVRYRLSEKFALIQIGRNIIELPTKIQCQTGQKMKVFFPTGEELPFILENTLSDTEL